MNKFNFYMAAVLCCCTVASQSFAMRKEAVEKGTKTKKEPFVTVKGERLLVPVFGRSYSDALNLEKIKKAGSNYLPSAGEAISIQLYDNSESIDLGLKGAAGAFGFMKRFYDPSKGPANAKYRTNDETTLANASVERDKFIDQALSVGKNLIVFTLSDTHDAWFRYDSIVNFIDDGIKKAGNKVRPLVVFSGDLAERYAPGGRSEALHEGTLLSGDLSFDFLNKLCGLCDVYYVLGNHDTQDGKEFDEFMEALNDPEYKTRYANISDHFHLLSNLTNDDHSLPFQSTDYNKMFGRYVISGNTLIFPYSTCYALAGLGANFTEECEGALGGVSTNWDNRALCNIYGNSEEDVVKSKDDLNLVMRLTMDNLYEAINKLAKQEGPLNIVFAAHDSYVKVIHFLERFFELYEVSPDIITRLNFSMSGGHDHGSSFGKDNGRYMVKVPFRVREIQKDFTAVSHGIFGEGVGMIALRAEGGLAQAPEIAIDSLPPQLSAEYAIQCHGETLAARTLRGDEERIIYVNLGDINLNSLNSEALLRVDFVDCPFWNGIQSSTFEELARNAEDIRYINEKLNGAFWTRAEPGCKKHIGTIVTICRGAGNPAFLFQMCAVNKNGQVVENLDQEGLRFVWRLRGLLESGEDVAKVESYMESVLKYRK